jgi:hypothetical protein
MTFTVVGDRGERLGHGKDLEQLRERLSGQVQRRMSRRRARRSSAPG